MIKALLSRFFRKTQRKPEFYWWNGILIRKDNGALVGRVWQPPVRWLPTEYEARHSVIGSLGRYLDERSARRALENLVGMNR